MARDSLCGHSLPRREVLAVRGRGVEQRERRLTSCCAPRHEGWPDDVDTLAIVDCQSRPILGTSVEHPVVLADTDGRGKRATAVCRHRERNIPHIPRVDVTPGRIDPAVTAGSNGGLAAIAHASRNGPRSRGIVETTEEQLRQLSASGAVRLPGCSRSVLVTGVARCCRPGGSVRQFPMIQPKGDDTPTVTCRDGFPPPVAWCVAAGHERRRRKRCSPVVRTCRPQPRARGRLGGPHHHDGRIAASSVNQRDSRRLLAREVRFARDEVDAESEHQTRGRRPDWSRGRCPSHHLSCSRPMQSPQIGLPPRVRHSRSPVPLPQFRRRFSRRLPRLLQSAPPTRAGLCASLSTDSYKSFQVLAHSSQLMADGYG